LEEVTKALVSDEANAAYIKADVGRGGGAAGSNNGGGQHKSLSEMTVDEEVAFSREYPDRYKQMIGA
jgi:hypothetical protein